MSIIVKANDSKSMQDGDINEERATRSFIAISDVATDPVTVATASGIPDYFDEHPADSSYLMKQKRVRSLGDEAGRFQWEVQCEYSNRIINPLDMPAQIEWDFSESSESYFFDTNVDTGNPNGHPVVNSAGQPFDSIPTRESGSITANITKNVAVDFDVSLFLSFREQVNSVGFTVDGVSLDTHQAKVSGANVSPPQLSNGTWYRTAKLVLKFRKTWDDEFADMGYQQKSALFPGSLVDIVVGNPLSPVTKPFPLDGSGAAKTNATDVPAKLTFKPYDEADYGDLSALLS